MDAFDADVLIYAAEPRHPLGEPIRLLFAAVGTAPDDPPAGVGSVLLVPEVLSKPRRLGAERELGALASLLDRLTLLAVDDEIADRATDLAARYRLHAADAIHLATAVVGGADRFITNNSKDFTDEISEITVVGPHELGGTEGACRAPVPRRVR